MVLVPSSPQVSRGQRTKDMYSLWDAVNAAMHGSPSSGQSPGRLPVGGSPEPGLSL